MINGLIISIPLAFVTSFAKFLESKECCCLTLISPNALAGLDLISNEGRNSGSDSYQL